MVIGKIKPTATIVAQFAAGVEIEAIQHDGKMYLPVVGMGEFSSKEEAPSRSEATPSSGVESKPSKKAPATSSAKAYTKEELMEMESKELVKICKSEFGINPDDHDGKNTNKKLRDLILEAQEKGASLEEAPDTEPDTEPEAADEESEENGALVDQVAEILEDFDAGKKNKKKAISAICALVDDADEDVVTEFLEKFEDDADADLDEMAEEIAKSLSGEKKSEKSAKKAPKRAKKSKEDLVAPEDLSVGDRVSVWWDDDNQEWFDGEVKSIKKGKIKIAYDDDTEELIDPEVHTKIKRLAE